MIPLLFSSRRRGVGYDAAASAFFAAASITDDTQKSAINALVIALKSAGLWTKIYALYPMVGGNATAHSYNLKNTAAFQITWSGGLTHNSSGVQGNGSTGFGDTGFNSSLSGWTFTQGGLAVYIRNNAASGYDMGASDGGASHTTDLVARYTGGNKSFAFFATDGQSVSFDSTTDSRGLFSMSKVGSVLSLYRNGDSIATNAVMTTSNLANRNVYLCCENRSGSAIEFSTHQYAMAIIKADLSDSEETALYAAVQAYQTALSRNV